MNPDAGSEKAEYAKQESKALELVYAFALSYSTSFNTVGAAVAVSSEVVLTSRAWCSHGPRAARGHFRDVNLKPERRVVEKGIPILSHNGNRLLIDVVSRYVRIVSES